MSFTCNPAEPICANNNKEKKKKRKKEKKASLADLAHAHAGSGSSCRSRSLCSRSGSSCRGRCRCALVIIRRNTTAIDHLGRSISLRICLWMARPPCPPMRQCSRRRGALFAPGVCRKPMISIHQRNRRSSRILCAVRINRQSRVMVVPR